jgi:hypothetical protein
MLSLLVGSLSPALPAVASTASLLIEPASESAGNDRDDAGSLCVSQPSHRRQETQPEFSGRQSLSARPTSGQNLSNSFGTGLTQFGEQLHRNGIGAPLRR